MRTRRLPLTSQDQARLERQLEILRNSNDPGIGPYLDALEEKLARTKAVRPDEVDPDVVTMDTRVTVRDLATGEEVTCVLGWPEAPDPDGERVSVLAPVGMALLGSRVGEVVKCRVPAGLRRLRVEEILFQPEAAGLCAT